MSPGHPVIKGCGRPRRTRRSTGRRDVPEQSMASKEKRGPLGPARGLGPPPSPPEAGAPAAAVGSESSAPPAQPPLTLVQPVSPGDPGFRLLLEENAFQALTQEPLLKRPRTSQDALSVGEGSLLCLPFPKKLWAIVNSTQFASIWWAKDGTCIGINEKLFQKEVLEREGPDKVFETDCMKSFVRQLNLYGFSKLRRDVHTSICLTSFLTGGAPVHVLGKPPAFPVSLGLCLLVGCVCEAMGIRGWPHVREVVALGTPNNGVLPARPVPETSANTGSSRPAARGVGEPHVTRGCERAHAGLPRLSAIAEAGGRTPFVN
ncbi:heat shock transcription factor, X-linked isoform X7 [Lutra lutra]|uniref:heat shock transcription factor, X-linked isoform X7 n=1 Tax=Lutra lutra TaxID=9657 RepID=UPI001FD51E7C|nr:heat shock transcription factor, X-linked isoform X7 [Lutra lutra]